MDYSFQVTTPANTPKNEAVHTEMKITEGVVTHVWMLHPRGCNGVAHATIDDGLSQIWPTNKDSDYAGNGVPMEFDENYLVLSPAKFWLNTWNNSTLYEHGCFVRITVQSKEQAQAWQTLSNLVAILKKLLGL